MKSEACSRGAAGIGEGALVDLDDVLPAELGQMPHYGIADDAGADHDYSSADREFTHLATPTFLLAELGMY